MPVSEKFKDAVRKSTKAWQERVLKRYVPTAKLASLDLDNTMIVRQRIDSLWTGLGHDRVRAEAWTIERVKHSGERCLLILMNPSIWDAESEWELSLRNEEFTVLDAEGVCFQTIVKYVEGEDVSTTRNVVEIPTKNSCTYYVDTYTYGGLFWTQPPPLVEAIGEPAKYVVHDEEGARWFAPISRVGRYSLELTDHQKRVVLKIGGRSLKEIVWQSFGTRTFGPKRRLLIRHLDKSVPKEVVLFLAAYVNI